MEQAEEILRSLSSCSDDILASLEFTKQKFENHNDYPTWEFKQQRIKDIEHAMLVVREAKKYGKNLEVR